ncbi:MAG: AMP-binding protein, partial [Mesorhizobium sp.]
MTRTPTSARLPRYDDAVARFRLEDEIARLQGDLAGLNACVECCDRHTGANRLALRAISADGALTEFSFEDLRDKAARVGNMLKDAGVGPGDVVAGMLPRIPDLVALILGTWRIGAVYQPLFTAFGPKAIEHRLGYSGAKLVVTNPANRGKLSELENCPPVAIVLAQGEPLPDGDMDFRAAIAAASPDCEPVMRKGDD